MPPGNCFAPLGLTRLRLGFVSQGFTLGYHVMPLWGNCCQAWGIEFVHLWC
jgi:hypothetical protein